MNPEIPIDGEVLYEPEKLNYAEVLSHEKNLFHLEEPSEEEVSFQAFKREVIKI